MPHGAVSLEWSQDIVTISVQGPFNLSGIVLADEKIRKNITSKDYATWYRLDVLDNDTLGCPDVMKVIGRSYLWSVNDDTCKGIAVVCANKIQLSMMEQFIQQHNLPISCYSNFDDASHYLKWIKY